MRVVIDTNVLFSALFYPSLSFNMLIGYLLSSHEMLVPEYIADELKSKALQKRPEQAELVDTFLRTLGAGVDAHPLVPVGLVGMRDVKDQPILELAIAANVDVIISGDKDFLSLEIDRPRIMSPRQFIDEFIGS